MYIVGQVNWYGLVHSLAIKTIKISEKGLQKNLPPWNGPWPIKIPN